MIDFTLLCFIRTKMLLTHTHKHARRLYAKKKKENQFHNYIYWVVMLRICVIAIYLHDIYDAHTQTHTHICIHGWHYHLRVFHISFSWWSFTGVWATKILLKSSGLFSVFWPPSITLSFGWPQFVLQLQKRLLHLIIL